MSGRTQFVGPRVPSLPERLKLKVIDLGVRAYVAFKRLRYRLRRRPGGKLLRPDHITISCGDLRVAKEFYVGILGADVMMRINRRLLERIGWADEDIEANRAVHLSLTLGAGPRLDLPVVKRFRTQRFGLRCASRATGVVSGSAH